MEVRAGGWHWSGPRGVAVEATGDSKVAEIMGKMKWREAARRGPIQANAVAETSG